MGRLRWLLVTIGLAGLLVLALVVTSTENAGVDRVPALAAGTVDASETGGVTDEVLPLDFSSLTDAASVRVSNQVAREFGVELWSVQSDAATFGRSEDTATTQTIRYLSVGAAPETEEAAGIPPQRGFAVIIYDTDAMLSHPNADRADSAGLSVDISGHEGRIEDDGAPVRPRVSVTFAPRTDLMIEVRGLIGMNADDLVKIARSLQWSE